MNNGLGKALLIGDQRGLMGVINQNQLPFPVQRMFWLANVRSGESRGGHAHRRCRQLVVCAAGSVTCRTESRTFGEESRKMTTGDMYELNTMTWLMLDDFSSDCVVIVLASEPYDESEYVRDYEIFRREIS